MAWSNGGLDSLKSILVEHVSSLNDSRETMLISHTRDKSSLAAAIEALVRGRKLVYAPELLAEELRIASYSMGRLIGEVGTEDVLDELFAGFCIGK